MFEQAQDDAEHLEQLMLTMDLETEPEAVTLPAIAESDRHAYLQLTLVPGIGPVLMGRLLKTFGTAQAALGATLKELGNIEGIGPKTATETQAAKTSDLVERVLDHCRETQTDIWLPQDRAYPALLREIAAPPLALYARGQSRPSDQLAIAMVGTRHATHYGRTIAERISRALCQFGFTIVSGLARGIDAVCHQAALDCGGRTIAVLGGGLSDIYPPEHRPLAERIAEGGLLLSETQPFAKPKAGVFPQRNRIISGVSVAVVVVEAAERSGSLITASHAGEQGRDVFAVPGPVTARTSRGSNRLIRDGAILIQDAEDIIEHLGPLAKPAETAQGASITLPVELQLNDVEQGVYAAIGTQPTDIDLIIARSGFGVPRVLSTISVLEMKSLIVRVGGRSVARRF